jgi:general secretion pathway protein D
MSGFDRGIVLIEGRARGDSERRNKNRRSGARSRWSRPYWSRCAALVISFGLTSCASTEEMAGLGPGDSVDPVRVANLSARYPANKVGGTDAPGDTAAGRPQLFPGFGLAFGGGQKARVADQAAATPDSGDAEGDAGVEINFDNAEIQTVAKAIVSDKLGLNVVVDPRVQGTVTIASAAPIAKKDLLSVFESVLRMSNATMIRENDVVKIAPLTEASGAGRTNLRANEPGFGVTIVPLRYASAAAVAKTAEGFLTRPGAVRADPTKNLLLIQGTAVERQNAVEMIASFDVEWLRNQSVGIYPLKSTSPDIMINELQKVFETADGGQGQGLISFQPIARMNAVLAVAHDRKFLEQTTQWVRRLDREDMSGTTLRVYRLEHGNATKIAKILSDIFAGRSPGSSGSEAASQLAPGANATQSRLDSIASGSSFSNNSGASGGSSGTISSNGSGSTQTSGGATSGVSPGNGASSFSGFSDEKSEGKSGSDSNSQFGALTKGIFQSVRITADTSNNSIIVYSNQDDYRVIERSIRELDRPQQQVGIDATIAEVTLTNALQYGVQYYIANHLGAVAFTGSQTARLQPLLPGFNAILGTQASPRVILSALSNLTSVKVLSAPSLVVSDNQPAFLQVGDSIPISTGTANVLGGAANTVVNTTTYQDTGVILKVWPHIHANGEVQLEIDQEVSGVVGGIPATGTSNLTPTLSERRVHSTVSVADGQTVLLGGLISDEDDRNQTGIPGLRQIRVIGDLFGTTNNTKTRTEIIVFVKPHIVQDSLDAQNVAEEFRARLDTMRSADTVLYAPTVPNAKPGSAASR